MCFTPIISLTTAIIEFIVATIILLFYKKTTINKLYIIFIYLLGLYQFTEFMLCQTNASNTWAVLGFITYTFLPGIGLHIAIRNTDSKFIKYEKVLYILPIIFSILGALYIKSGIYAKCSTYFLESRLLFLNNFNHIPYFSYLLYYFGFILLSLIILLTKYKKEKIKIKKQIYAVYFLSIITSLLPALILIIIIPSMGIMFPSIYCEFAILFTIAALISAQLEKKI